MKPAAVAAELRKAQGGTLEEKRLALARIKLARLRQAKAAPKAKAGEALGSVRIAAITTNNPRAGVAAVRALMRALDNDIVADGRRRPRR